jgi:dihydrofolate reductase
MTESGLVGAGGAMPWKSSVDSRWFRMQTGAWPVIFGRRAAESMPTFPLRNRPCAVISSKLRPSDDRADIFSDLSSACVHFRNFDNIFVAGGVRLYETALAAEKPWDPGEPMIDYVVATIFPDGYADGDVYMGFDALARICRNFSLLWSGELKYDLKSKKYAESSRNCGVKDLSVRDGDTLFPWIRFEIRARSK